MPDRPNVASDGLNAVAVVGSEAVATATAALDFARAEARHRRVTIVDLIGDAPPLRAVAITDDPHGIADCFEYGVSFTAISRPTTVHPNVSILPSGSEPVPYADALPSKRWDRLIVHARQHGEVLVFALLSGTPAMAALTSRVDCVVAAPSRLREVLESEPSLASAPAGKRRRTPWGPGGPRAPGETSGSRWQATGLAAASLVLLAGLGWLITRRQPATAPTEPPTASPGVATASSAPARDTVTSSAQLAGAAASAPIAPPANESPKFVIADPLDSSLASSYAIRIGTFDTYAEALRALRHHPARRHAATVAPLGSRDLTPSQRAASPASGPLDYVLMAGAARTPSNLDALAAQWSRPPRPPTTVIRAPLALRLTTDVRPDSAQRLAADWLARGIPAYVLIGPSGTGTVYAGAFVQPEQTVALATSLRSIGLAPVIAYRIGHAP